MTMMRMDRPAWREVKLPEGWEHEQWVRREAARLRAEHAARLVRRSMSALARWLGPLWRRHQRNADLRQLLALDDRVLADIGLRRADLEALKHGVVPWEQVFEPRAPRGDAGGGVVRLARRGAAQPQPRDLDRAA